MNTQLVTKLIQKRLTFPCFSSSKGNSRTLARQLDSAMMKVGFKLSGDLIKHLGSVEFTDALKASSVLIDSVKQLVGDHIKHNVYFKDFPKNVPDTLEFWTGLLIKFYWETGTLTNNLLDFPEYGKYQHTYEDMLAAHSAFKPKNLKLKVVNLGATEQDELNALFTYLAESSVPLNVEDRGLLEQLYLAGFRGNSLRMNFSIRENKAIVNALRIGKEPIDVDTPIDLLRLSAHLSGGDVTLTEKTKFKSFSRPIRRAIISALNEILEINPEKIEDVSNRREEFKRLAERLHPFEFVGKYSSALHAFEYAAGDLKVSTWANKTQTALKTGKIAKAVSLLSEKPGYLMRSIDQIARKATDAQFDNLLESIKDNANRVSGRVLLSVIEHLDNRVESAGYRLFVNKTGTGFSKEGVFKPLSSSRITSIQKTLWKELATRIAPIDVLCIDERLDTVAVPISEKNKSEGFRVLPRGSTFALDRSKNILRFFTYWKQKSERTDYDLSVAFYDKDFEFLGQGSWTSLTRTGFRHSGDITSAENGATEFIDADLRSIDSSVAYIVPTINIFTGETFASCEESFFGFMSLSSTEKGKPFEPTAVQMKFALRGDKKVGVPMVFARTESGFEAKWLDLYCKGSFAGNRVEATKFSTALLAKSLIQRKYLTCNRLLDLYRNKAKKFVKTCDKSTKNLVYVGLERPENVPADAKVYTLDNLKELIPV